MRYYIIAGEASGDLHAANLMKELKLLDTKAEFRFWGGDLMQEQGGELVTHFRELAFMGFVEVVANIKTIFQNLKFCKQDISNYDPDVLILVDYPGFNLRIAKFAKSIGYKVIYYISPKVWAWKASRVYTIKKYIDRMLCILPFEQDFYRQYNYDVDYVGHPLLDAIEKSEKPIAKLFKEENNLDQRPIIALLPGSRKQEVYRMLKVMIQVADHFPYYQFVIAGANGIDIKFYQKVINQSNVKIVFSKTYDLLQLSSAALVASGTATLETALFDVPQIVCYKGNSLSVFIARLVLKIRYISLVNLIANRQIVAELIQKEVNVQKMTVELDELLSRTKSKNEMLSAYAEIKTILGSAGASKRVARIIFSKK